MLSGVVYKVTNNENGYVYIGATTGSIRRRKLDHVERANRGEEGKFQEAIGTYGTEAFTWEQVDTASSTDELAQKEKQCIIENNSKEIGYNSDSGGGFKKSVYKYSIEDGTLIEKFECLNDAGITVNASKQDISRACLSVNQTFSGYYWSYEYKEPFEQNKDERKKNVQQYNLKNELIAEFCSVAEASRETGISKSCISRVCRGERANTQDFVFRYS